MSAETTPPTRARAVTSAYVWGYDNRGGLGLRHAARVHVPTPARLPNNVINVQGGATFTLALTGSGAVYGWGGNSFGELGDGITRSRLQPSRVPLPESDGWQLGVASSVIGNLSCMLAPLAASPDPRTERRRVGRTQDLGGRTRQHRDSGPDRRSNDETAAVRT